MKTLNTTGHNSGQLGAWPMGQTPEGIFLAPLPIWPAHTPWGTAFLPWCYQFRPVCKCVHQQSHAQTRKTEPEGEGISPAETEEIPQTYREWALANRR